MNPRSVTARRIGIGLVAACATLLTSCAAGQNAQTADEVPAIDGSTGSIGTMELHAFAVQAPTDATSFAVGEDVRVDLVLVNIGSAADKVTGLSTPAAAGWGVYKSSADASAVQAADNSPRTPTESAAATSQPAPPPTGATTIAVPAGMRVAFGTPTASRVLMLLNLSKKLYPGESIPITVKFAHAGSVTLTVPIQVTSGQSRLFLPTDGAGE